MDFEAHINADPDPRMKKGKELMDLLDPNANKVLYDSIGEINPDLADYVLKFAYGEIINRPQLSLEKRELATISALVAMGNARNQLKTHIQKGITYRNSERRNRRIDASFNGLCWIPRSDQRNHRAKRST
jgi:alkylhydroperoxidase/carboxymuconolactone decarboxylase family protein YurZ